MALAKKQQQEQDKSISRLIKYIGNEGEWSKSLEIFMVEVLENLAEHFGLSPDDIMTGVEGSNTDGMLHAFLLEEFLANELSEEGESPIEEFLRRRGWREKPVGRQYLKVLCDIPLDLWEVTSVKPGRSMSMRLLGTDDKPVRVYEKSASQMLVPWSCLVARVLPVHQHHVISGGVLPLNQDQGFRLLDEIDQLREALEEELPDPERGQCMPDLDKFQILPEVIAKQAKADVLFFSTLVEWLNPLFAPEQSNGIQLQNKDGDEFAFCKVRFPISNGRDAEIIKRLETVETLKYTQDRPPRWVWLTEPSQGPGIPISTLGQLSLEKAGLLEIEVNSDARADKAQKLFGDLLVGCVGKALVVHESFDQSLKGRGEQSFETSAIPNEKTPDQLKMMQQFMDQHYKIILDQPIVDLDNYTPRECAADEMLRGNAVRWLKRLEQLNHSQGRANNLPPYDSRWMWEELGLDRNKYSPEEE